MCVAVDEKSPALAFAYVRLEYAAAVRSTPQKLLRLLIQRLAVVAPFGYSEIVNNVVAKLPERSEVDLSCFAKCIFVQCSVLSQLLKENLLPYAFQQDLPTVLLVYYL